MILYGKPVALSIEEKIKKDIDVLAQSGVKPFLAVILVGNDPASILYTRKKKEKAQQLGVDYRLYHLPETSSDDNVINLIQDLNQNKNVHGIIVQLPLPQNFETKKILSVIQESKDVDGLNGGFVPPTAEAILDFYF